MAWSPDGRMIASGAEHGVLRLWDVEEGSTLRESSLTVKWFHSVAWSPDGRLLACGVGDAVYLWNVSGDWRSALEGQSLSLLKAATAHDLAWSPDGRWLAAGGSRTYLLDAETGEVRLTLGAQDASVLTLAWSPGGETLASGGRGGDIQLWDVNTGRLKSSIEGHTGHITGLSFSCDGRLLASKSGDRTVKLWRGDTGEAVCSIEEAHGGSDHAGLAFHPSRPLLATHGGPRHAVCIWALDADVLLRGATNYASIHYTTAKVALVGDSGVGKTGLGWRLAHGEFREHPSTHGQQFWVVDELGTTRADGTECEAVLWDLAGQPDYRLIHALFLDDIDLALLLFDPTDRVEPLKGVEYWLRQLSQKGRPTILVGARDDRGASTMTREELMDFCHRNGISHGYVSTSALTGAGLTELLERVKAAIDWSSMPATVTTATFKRVKEFILSLKEADAPGGVLVTAEGLRERLAADNAEWEFTDAEMLTAMRHLGSHGYVSALRGSGGEETILIAPDLLANLASTLVLEARRNEKGLGALDEARVLRGEYKLPEVTNLDGREREVLLDAAVALFLEHNLCFRETLGAQTLLIFPALINQKRLPPEGIEAVDDFSYRISGAIENVYAALVVQLGYTNTFARTHQWHGQAEYETARGNVCGFRQVGEREGGLELVLYHAREKSGARLLFQGLFEEFLRGRDVTVTKYPPVTCHVCDYVQQRHEVVKRIDEGRGFLFCGECGGKIMLPSAGEEVSLSRADRARLGEERKRTRRRTAFETALVRVKRVARSENKPLPSCFVSYAWGDERQERWVRGLTKDLENAGVAVALDQKDNPQPGANVARFVGLIEQSDFVIVVGTPLYRKKYENKVSDAGSVVAAEVDQINLRLTRTEKEKATVLPLLLEGDEATSFPPLVRGKVYGRFDEDELYFPSLFDLILTLYRIPFTHPAIADLRDELRGHGAPDVNWSPKAE